MQSLKDLRKASAAAVRQISRTGDAAGSELPSSVELGQASPNVATTTSAAAGVPRVGRTLAPLTSAGSLVQGTSRDDPSSDVASNTRDDALQEDRETRRRRRRRRRDKEHRHDDSSHGVDEGAAAVSVASRSSTAVVGEEGSALISAEEGGLGLRGGGFADGRSEEETSRERAAEEKDALDENATGPAPPLSARGLPPQERPFKKLSKLEARRARIEQQKREETERAAGASAETLQADASRLPSDSYGGAREGTKMTLEMRSDSGRASNKADGDDHSSAAGYPGSSRRDRGSDRTAVAERKGIDARDAFDRGNQEEKGVAVGLRNESKEGMRDERDEHHAEQDPLISDAAASSKPELYDDAAEHVESTGADVGIGIARGGSSEPAGGGDDDLEDAADGRFKGMRSRMKKAGQGLINKSPTFRRMSADGKVRLGGARSKNAEDETEGGGGGFKETAPDTAAGVDGAREAGGDTNANRASRGGLSQNQEHSDTESNGSVLSPMMSETENDEVDGYGVNARGKGRKKNWRRKKGPAEATADGNTEGEVTLGHVVDRKMREMGYIRKPAVENLKNRRALRDRVAAEGAPEVHFIGEVSGAEGFGSGISCRFRVEGGRHWTCLAGLEEGQTHVIHADYGESFTPWNHPIDLHYTTKSIQGWPRLILQVWQLDVHGRNVLRGYGFRHLPSTPGFSEVSVPCWRPTGTMQEETAAFFLGVTPRLTAEDAVFNRAWDQRCRLVTLPAGTVWIQMSGLFRNFQDQGVDGLSFT